MNDPSRNFAKGSEQNVAGVVQLSVIMLIFASLFIYIGVSSAYKELFAAAHFLPTEAIVRTASVRQRAGKSGPSYVPEISYTYSSNGSSYTSTDTFVVGYAMSYQNAARIVDSHLPGTHCLAYYNPSDPHVACLIKEKSSLPYIFAFIGLIPLGIAFWALFDLWKKTR